MNRMIKKYGVLVASFLFYSLAVLCGKYASSFVAFSINFILFYGFQIFFLGLYAVFWQFALSYHKLNVAYPLKSVTIVVGMILGAVLFDESVHFMQLFAVSLIFCGVYLVSDYE